MRQQNLFHSIPSVYKSLFFRDGFVYQIGAFGIQTVLFLALVFAQGSPLQADENASEKSDSNEKKQKQEEQETSQDQAETEKEPAEKYQLAYKFEPNEFVHYKMVYEMTFKTQAPDASEKARNHSETYKHYRVVSVDSEGNAVLEPVIDRVRMEAQFNDADPTVYDSQDSGKQPKQFSDVGKTVGKPLARMKVASNGKLISVTKLTDIGKAAKDPTKNFLTVLPKEPIAVGDTWKERYEIPVKVTRKLSRDIPFQRTYKLVSVDGNRAKIEMKTAILANINSPKMKARLIQRTPGGTIIFDMKKGLIVSRELNIDRTVIGVGRANSSMRATSHSIEKLIPPEKAAQEKAVAAEKSETQTK